MDRVHRPLWADRLLRLLNALVIAGSILVITGLSVEVFHDPDLVYGNGYMHLQLGVCIVFLIDFFARLWFAPRKGRFIASNFVFLLVAIPYMHILPTLGIELGPEAAYLLRLMPLVRGGYGLAVAVGWIARNRATSLTVSYVLMLLALTYFASLVFYLLEHGVNPAVASFGDSLSWAFMNMTTVGSQIAAQTATGKVFAVVLAAAGMMLFPIFTVYITNRLQSLKGDGGQPPADRQDS